MEARSRPLFKEKISANKGLPPPSSPRRRRWAVSQGGSAIGDCQDPGVLAIVIRGESGRGKSMDESTRQMIAEAYGETVSEALGRGVAADKAHVEGITAAAMFLASMVGLEDAAARAEVEKMGLKSG